MSWLFGQKKKVPKVPLPEGRSLGEGALQFSSSPSSGRVIEPDRVKEAVGIRDSLPSFSSSTKALPSFPEMVGEEQPLPNFKAKAPVPPTVSVRSAPSSPKITSYTTASMGKEAPLFVKVDTYKKVLGELDGLRVNLSHLAETQRHLEESEFNEEDNFEKLKRAVKGIHDRFLQVDKTLFKTQGD